jgi:NAD(P)H dehydrogenase (quinone)
MSERRTTMVIGVTGATGQLGRLVVDKLEAKVGASGIVALVRSPQKAADLGVPARKADYDEPGTLATALAGVNTLLLISGNEVGRRAAQHRNIIEAAKAAGVTRIVYTSLLHADRSSMKGLSDEHFATETAVKTAGIPFTILRNGWYTENYTGSVPGAVAGGALLGSAGEGKIASATRADFADAAVAVLTTDGHDGRTYELAGDEAYTLSDLAAEISRQTGKPVPYRNLPEADYAAALTGFGLPRPVAEAIAGWDVSASHGALFDDSHELSALIGRSTTPLAVAVAEALKPRS